LYGTVPVLDLKTHLFCAVLYRKTWGIVLEDLMYCTGRPLVLTARPDVLNRTTCGTILKDLMYLLYEKTCGIIPEDL
jgi:hypothetical protein